VVGPPGEEGGGGGTTSALRGTHAMKRCSYWNESFETIAISLSVCAVLLMCC
jgi:hypothetical protein